MVNIGKYDRLNTPWPYLSRLVVKVGRGEGLGPEDFKEPDFRCMPIHKPIRKHLPKILDPDSGVSDEKLLEEVRSSCRKMENERTMNEQTALALIKYRREFVKGYKGRDFKEGKIFFGEAWKGSLVEAWKGSLVEGFIRLKGEEKESVLLFNPARSCHLGHRSERQFAFSVARWQIQRLGLKDVGMLIMEIHGEKKNLRVVVYPHSDQVYPIYPLEDLHRMVRKVADFRKKLRVTPT